ncbi:MAG: hypothetical protein AAGI49_02815 [Bacteroidota bacterium]
MNLLLRAIVISYLLSLLFACNTINPEEDIPAYLQIDTINFVATNPTYGTSNHKIVEAWVSVDGVFLGVYDLPATIPVLASGTADIRIRAGIKDNGIGRLPEIYPFFQPYDVTRELVPAEIIKLNPSVSYREDINFAFVEEFEAGDGFFIDDLDGNDSTRLVLSTVDAFEGNGSGLIQLTASNPVAELATDFNSRLKDLQTRGVEVYLEVNYRTDVEVAFGVIGHDAGIFSPIDKVYEPILFPKATWNKVYLNLSQAVFDVRGEEYQIVIFTALAPGQTTGFVQLDNMKLIHF